MKKSTHQFLSFHQARYQATLCALLVAGAANAQAPVQAPPSAAPPAVAEARPGAMARILGRTERLLVVLPATGDTAEALAERFLGRADRAWWLQGDQGGGIVPGEPLVVPLQHPNPIGFTSAGMQTVPILGYHRFGPSPSAMVVTPEQFEAHLQTLTAPGMNVLPLSALPEFLAGRSPLPPASVAITVDDGHESFYRLAFPLIKQYKLPVTLFIHTDAIGTRDFMTWEQLREVAASGLISVQAHSKTHQNLAAQPRRESDLNHRRRLEVEVQTPRKLIEQELPETKVSQFAYPHGQASAAVLDTLQRNAFELGLTARPGGNAFFQPPFLLQRSLVLGSDNLETFKARLTTRQEGQL